MTLSALDLLALTIYGEARGETHDGRIAVANVVRNRLKTHRWGASYERVCLAPMQFSCWSPHGGVSNFRHLQELALTIVTGPAPTDPVLAACYQIAADIQSGVTPDTVHGATFYFVTDSKIPTWAIGEVPVCVIGKHSFFAGIR